MPLRSEDETQNISVVASEVVHPSINTMFCNCLPNEAAAPPICLPCQRLPPAENFVGDGLARRRGGRYKRSRGKSTASAASFSLVLLMGMLQGASPQGAGVHLAM